MGMMIQAFYGLPKMKKLYIGWKGQIGSFSNRGSVSVDVLEKKIGTFDNCIKEKHKNEYKTLQILSQKPELYKFVESVTEIVK